MGGLPTNIFFTTAVIVEIVFFSIDPLDEFSEILLAMISIHKSKLTTARISSRVPVGG